ncbi:hypothetical protein EKW15_08235 [Campylobacter jejuni]|nr:hypothetical protein [Campylobacter jejuni]EAL8748345.1 hypothetical protein [Campylobacter jejuni]
MKWILWAHKGWNKEFQKYLLQPVDKNGKKLFAMIIANAQVMKMTMVDLILLGRSIQAGELIVNQTSVIFI